MLRSAQLFMACACSVQLSAQIELDKPMLLTSPNESDRQVTGLPASLAPNAVLTATLTQSNTFRTVAPQYGVQWTVDLPSLSEAPVAGTQLVISVPTTSPGAVQLLVNGHGPYAVLSGPNAPLLGEEVPPGTSLSVVMDGTAFHVLNGHVPARRPCPAGTIAVNQQYCIEPGERAATDFFSAIDSCSSGGLRLCGWSEFLIACQRASELGLLEPIDSWEWTNDASNENNCARIVGGASCLSAGNALVTGSLSREFRCCYSR